MKIAFVLTEFPSISETFILEQIIGLLKRGHDVEIFAKQKGNHSEAQEEIEVYRLMKRTTYFNMPKDIITRAAKAFFLAIGNLKKDPVKIWKSLNYFRYRNSRLIYFLVSFLPKKFEIIHCHFGSNGILAAQAKDIGVSGKVVTAFHGVDMSAFVQKYGNAAYRTLFSKGDLFMPISDYWKNKLIKMGCPEHKITVHRMGIDLGNFRFCERKPSGTIKILSVGRLVQKKGHEYAIRAVAKLMKGVGNIEYVIAGDGPLREKLQRLAAELNIEERVKFLGAISHEKVRQLYGQFHIFVLPSITADDGDQEGIPVVLMEAMATGVPVVSTFHSGIPELIEDGISGFLVPERDVDALAGKLKFLIQNTDIWGQVSHRARKVVEENYNIEKLNDLLVGIYEDLRRGNNPGEPGKK
jgi:colanic acid/amylovoran biosynthesis glycosyltransferase